ncbi:MAG: transcriptional regulator [Candidatus Dadabacteria bacterium]|nr:MAG: transcriptional regulator [Candidatus Dadabacteria bacterium]
MVRRDPSGQRPTVESTQGATSVAAMLESVVGCKWSVRVLEILARGRSRPSQILRECPGLSAKVMNERLRKLMRYGIVERSVYGEKPPVRVEYALTPFGRRFIEIVEAVRRLQEEIDRAQGGPR